MPDQPKDRASLSEIMLGLGLALLLAPGAIWCIGTIIGVFSDSVVVGCR